MDLQRTLRLLLRHVPCHHHPGNPLVRRPLPGKRDINTRRRVACVDQIRHNININTKQVLSSGIASDLHSRIEGYIVFCARTSAIEAEGFFSSVQFLQVNAGTLYRTTTSYLQKPCSQMYFNCCQYFYSVP
jgi:hypothetical protein